MSLVGSILEHLDTVLDLVRRDGSAPMEEIVRTGILPERPDYGHLDMRLFRWRELRDLLEPHGEIVAASAAGLLRADPGVRFLQVRVRKEPMRVTSKGQVTIPIEIRERLGIQAGTEVEFRVRNGVVELRKTKGSRSRGWESVEHLRGRATSGMSTDEIMALTRGE